MKLRINEKDTSMKYKTYGNIEKCFNILVNEKGYSKEEAQDIIDHMLADYKYNPNSNDSLLRRVNLVLSKDEYKKEFGIVERFTRLKEKETPNIEVKNKGILEVPEGKNVDDLPLSHFVNLANKKGLSKITKALNNLQVWNKNDDPKLSKWAGNMIDKLNNKLKKDESVSVKDIRAITNSDRAMDYLTKIQSNERNLSNFTPYERKAVLRNTRKYVKYINDEIKDTLPIMQQEEDDYNNYFLQNESDDEKNTDIKLLTQSFF